MWEEGVFMKASTFRNPQRRKQRGKGDTDVNREEIQNIRSGEKEGKSTGWGSRTHVKEVQPTTDQNKTPCVQ